MIRKELRMRLLVYNLVRELMGQAAERVQRAPHEISFKAALQTLNRFQELLSIMPPRRWRALFDELLRAVATHRVGNRPNR